MKTRLSKPVLNTLLLLALMVLGAQTASATAIVSRATGLVAPGSVIDFSEIVLPDDTVMGGQYGALGVSGFSGLWYNGCPSCVTVPPDGAKPDLTNFSASQTGAGVDFSITFDGLVSEAAFAFASNAGAFAFWAFDGAVGVDSVVVTIDTTLCNDTSGWCYYGFEGGPLFDRIVVETPTGTAALIDNLQFTRAEPIPEPGSLALLGLGLAGLGVRRRRRA